MRVEVIAHTVINSNRSYVSVGSSLSHSAGMTWATLHSDHTPRTEAAPGDAVLALVAHLAGFNSLQSEKFICIYPM